MTGKPGKEKSVDQILAGFEGQFYDLAQRIDEVEQENRRLRATQDFYPKHLEAVRAAFDQATARVAALLAAKPHDAVVRKALELKQGGWTKFQRDGAADEQILLLLKTNWPEYGARFGGAAGTQPYRRGGNSPRLWLDNAYGTGKPDFEGKALAAEARRILGIPQPKKAAPKPAPKKAAPAAAAAPKAKPAAKKKPPKKDKPHNGGAGGASARAAGIAGKADPRDDDDAGLDATPMHATYGLTYTGAVLGLNSRVIDEALSNSDLRPDQGEGGRIPYTIVVPTKSVVGKAHYAVILGSMQTEIATYTLRRVYEVGQWKAPTDTWARRRQRYMNRAPEDVPIDGVRLTDADGTTWVIGFDDEVVKVQAPRGWRPSLFDAAAASSKAKELMASGVDAGEAINRGTEAGLEAAGSATPLTDEVERDLPKPGYASGGEEDARRMIAEFRKRRAAGDVEPRWGKWAEFTIDTAKGQVRALYEPDTLDGGSDHLQFHGPISPTDYRSHFFGRTLAKGKGVSLTTFAAGIVRALQEELDREQAKAARRAKTAPKKEPLAGVRGIAGPGFRPLSFGQWFGTFKVVYDTAVGFVGAHKKLDADDARIHKLYAAYPDKRPSDAAREFAKVHDVTKASRKPNGAASKHEPAAVAVGTVGAAYQHAPAAGEVAHA